jgi:hypothetical protein
MEKNLLIVFILFATLYLQVIATSSDDMSVNIC